METINKEIIASVAIVEVKLSEDELAVYEAALTYTLDTMGRAEIEHRFGASIDEIEAIRDDLRDILEQHGASARKLEPTVK